jgi:anaerobic selenocysteine-containing dehydrogenase
MYGNNNLPDSSNMCHESTSVALPQTIGVPVGTVKIEDFDHTDCVMFFGQNVGVNSPRMLHQLQEVRERGVPIITFNPLRERGLESFTNPQSPTHFQWPEIEACSGLSRAAIESAAGAYRNAKSVIACYGMGLTQHRSGVLAIQMLSNLLLIRGNIGKPGAGIFPVRGHSNVQGQRTVGITEKPDLVPLDCLAEQYGFDPPRERGLDTVGTCEAVRDGSVKVFISLGGNFIRAIPETDLMERAWRQLEMTVQIVTKLNRGAIIHGKKAYLLPCLGRIEIDSEATGVQFVTVEDTTGRFHASHGQAEPACKDILSEPKIVAELAKAILAPNLRANWDAWSGNYALVRDAIAETYPKIFENFNERIKNPAGFDRPLPARERKWCASHLLLWQTRGQDWRPNTNPMKHFSARFLSWNSASLMKLCRWL